MKNLRKLRNNKKISMKELGSLIGVSESTISLYENGKRQPDFLTLINIADFFDVSIDYLLGREDRQKEEPLLPNEGDELIKQALKDTGLLDQNGALSEKGDKIIAKFLRDNADTLKIMLQLSKQES